MKSFWKLAVFSILTGVLFAGCVSEFRGNSGAGNTFGSKKRNVPAAINNVAVTESEIRSEAADELQAMELKKLREAAAYARSEREVMMTAMERVIEEKLLALEAAKQGISKEQLIDREILRKVEEPSEEEIDRVYELNRTRVNRPKEDVADQIKSFLREMSEKEIRDVFIGQLEQKHKVVRNLEPYRFDVKTVGHPSLGPNAAPVKLVLFSDFDCPYCLDYGVTLMEIVRNYGDRVQLVFRQFPLTNIHPNAQRAAEASLCARDQGRFWEAHDILFENQRRLTEENILKQMASLNIDNEKFRECLTSGRHAPAVRDDIRAAAAAGADSTPTLFINGISLRGGQPYDAIADAINKELTARGISLERVP
jgi:protein-disulfide isomerase